MRVGVFRAAADGRRTAVRLAELGHEAVLAPVLRIVATGATVDPGTADALIFTSAHAPEAMAGLPGQVAALRHLPCWCVGGQTARAAREVGFTQVGIGSGDATALTGAMVADGTVKRPVLLAGRDRKPHLEHALLQAGIALRVVDVYVAEAVPAWSDASLTRLETISAALHYSRRSAELALRLSHAAGLAPWFASSTHHCLSSDVAAALRAEQVPRVTVADKPDEESLLALLGPGR